MKHIGDAAVSIVGALPDPALWTLYGFDRALTRARRLVQLRGSVRRSPDMRGSRQRANFLCFLGVNWFSKFMLRKMRECGFYCFTHKPLDAFRAMPRDKNEFSKFELPVDHVTQPDFVIVDHLFYRKRRIVFGHEAMRAFVRQVSRGFCVPLIGIDSSDTVLYKFHPKSLDCFDLILKGHGLPKDRELMNWETGVRWGLNRKDKIRRVRHKDMVLSQDQIDKFRVSFDIGVAAYGDVDLTRPPSVPESNDVFFVGVFNSLNRLEGLRIARQHFKTLGWLQMIEGHPVVGIESWKADPLIGRTEDRSGLVRESNRLYRQHGELFRRARLSPHLYKVLAYSSKIMPAFSGIGELGPRHYQALAFKKVMMCEDVSHIETIFPFEGGRNCVFVGERLADFEDKVRWLLENDRIRHNLASEGFAELQKTYRDGNAIFERYFLSHLGIGLKQ